MFWRPKKDDGERGAEQSPPSYSLSRPTQWADNHNSADADASEEEEVPAQEDLLNAEEAFKMTQEAPASIEQETAEQVDQYFDEIISSFKQTVQKEADKGHRFAILATSGEFEGPADELEAVVARPGHESPPN